MALPLTASWITVVVCALVLGISAICLIGTETGREEVGRIAEKVEKKASKQEEAAEVKEEVVEEVAETTVEETVVDESVAKFFDDLKRKVAWYCHK